MAILVELNTTDTVLWRDTSESGYQDGADAAFIDSATFVTDTSISYLSLNGVQLDHYWEPYIESFAPPQYQTATYYGGFVKMGFGQITFSLDLFSSKWIPPKQQTINIRYTATTEGEAVDIFSGSIFLESFNKEVATYKLNDPKYTQKLLDEGANYEGDTVPYPKAFGAVTHVEPLKVADNGIYPAFHLGGLGTGTDAKAISSFSLYAAGTQTKVSLAATHSWVGGASIKINGTVNFNGIHTLATATSSTSFVIPVAFPAGNSENLPVHANAFTAGAFAVYDTGVPIQDNVIIFGDGTFGLTESPVGKVTISGTGVQTDLEEIIDWGRGRLTNIGSLATANARASSPSVSYWATSQKPLIDFMSEVCAFFTHYFYIKNEVLTLGDMLLNNSLATLDEFDYFDVSYITVEPHNQIKSNWVTHIATTGLVDEVKKAHFIEDIDNTVIESIQVTVSGTTDGVSANKLLDSGATFSSDGVLVGDTVQNTTDDTSAIVLEILSETYLALDGDIFVSGEEYIVGPSFPYGQELTIEPYHDIKSNVSAALVNILSILNLNNAEIKIPISGTLPDPGKKITFTDTQMISDTSTYIRARTLSYDFANEEILIVGEGVIS